MKLAGDMPADMTGNCFFTHEKTRGIRSHAWVKVWTSVLNSDPTLKYVWPAVGLRVLIKL